MSRSTRTATPQIWDKSPLEWQARWRRASCTIRRPPASSGNRKGPYSISFWEMIVHFPVAFAELLNPHGRFARPTPARRQGPAHAAPGHLCAKPSASHRRTYADGSHFVHSSVPQVLLTVPPPRTVELHCAPACPYRGGHVVNRRGAIAHSAAARIIPAPSGNSAWWR